MLRLARRGRPWVSACGALAVAWALLAGCETSPPELYDLQWLLLDFDDRELDQRYESLSLFVRAGDADGADDLDELYVIFDEGELFWRLTAATWTRAEHEGATWVGSTTISMPSREPFPAGEYRLLLLDRGGQRDAARFVIPAQRRPTAAPEITAHGPRFEVGGAAPYQLWVAAADGVVTTLAATGTVDLEERFDFRAGTRYQVYVFGQAEGADKGYLSGPYRWEAP